MSTDRIPASKQALAEAVELAAEILRNIELSEIPLANVALKAARLARLLNDDPAAELMSYEVAGYPVSGPGIGPVGWRAAGLAGRHYKEHTKGETKTYAYIESIEALEAGTRSLEESIKYSNSPGERAGLQQKITRSAQRLSSRRAFVHAYALRKYNELRFSGIADDIFARVRERVDGQIGRSIPESIRRLTSAYENLRSENPEDWSNAVHSCRRVLQDLADALFPPTQEIRKKKIHGKEISIHLGADKYINRLVAFVEDSSTSSRFSAVVGGQLEYFGNRLDAIYGAANKGSHETIVDHHEADRYVVYTYLLVGDLLTLLPADTRLDRASVVSTGG